MDAFGIDLSHITQLAICLPSRKQADTVSKQPRRVVGFLRSRADRGADKDLIL
jgi:hypothetical protein